MPTYGTPGTVTSSPGGDFFSVCCSSFFLVVLLFVFHSGFSWSRTGLSTSSDAKGLRQGTSETFVSVSIIATSSISLTRSTVIAP